MINKQVLLVCAAVMLAGLTGCSSGSVNIATSQAETPAPTPTPTPEEKKDIRLTEIPAVEITPVPLPDVLSGPESAAEAAATPVPTASPTPTPDPDKGLPVIGEKSEAADVYKIRLVNKTGMDIIGIEVKSDDMSGYPENLMPSSQSLKDGEKAVFYYNAADALKEAGDGGTKPVFRVRFTFPSDSVVIHNFPFGTADEVQIFVEDTYGSGYLVYTPEGGQEINTEREEVHITKVQLGIEDDYTPEQTADTADDTAPSYNTDGDTGDDGTDAGTDNDADTADGGGAGEDNGTGNDADTGNGTGTGDNGGGTGTGDTGGGADAGDDNGGDAGTDHNGDIVDTADDGGGTAEAGDDAQDGGTDGDNGGANPDETEVVGDTDIVDDPEAVG